MSNKAILFILIMFSVGIKCYNNYYLQTINHYKSYLGSQRYCPSTGRKTVYTSCIQDPSLNNAFIISVESIKNIGEIQGSLNKNDKTYLNAYELATADGIITEKERGMLSFQAKTLGLSDDRLKFLESHFDDKIKT